MKIQTHVQWHKAPPWLRLTSLPKHTRFPGVLRRCLLYDYQVYFLCILFLRVKSGTPAQKLPGVLPSVSLKFLAAQGKSPGNGVFDRFPAKEWTSLGCLFSGRGMTKSSAASFSHFIVWPPSYQKAAVFPFCLCGLSWFEWWRR
jgi:hypothetical protein